MGEGKFPVSKPVGLSPAKTWESWFRFKKQQKEPKDSSKTKELIDVEMNLEESEEPISKSNISHLNQLDLSYLAEKMNRTI